MSEMVIILAVALLVFGPQKLPEIARGIAKGLRELRRAGDDLRASVDLEGDEPRRTPAYRAPPRPATPLPETPAHIAGSELAAAEPALPATSAGATATVEPEPPRWPQPADGTQALGSLEGELAAERTTSADGEPPDAPPGEAKGS